MRKFYGAIVGDIVGSVYEFNNIKTKDFPLFSKKSFATDDSIMTLAIASALMDAAEDGSFDVKTDAEWIASFRDSMRRIGIPYPYCGYGGRFLDWMYSEDPQPY